LKFSSFGSRRGIEKEYWVLKRNEQEDTVLDIRNSRRFAKTLAEFGGSWEYQWNAFELKTETEEEERDPRIVELKLSERLEKLIEAAKEFDPKALVLCAGSYPGRDDPNIDTSESLQRQGDNAFWGEFNLVFPADAFTRYTTADQLNISMMRDGEEERVQLYNRMVGLSPLLIYCFSTSPHIQGIPLNVWSRRQQLIDAKGVQSGQLFPGTYPLRSTAQYQRALERAGDAVEEKLARFNPHFFCQDGKTPREVVAEYRGSEWSFFKLLTQQVVRFNQKDEIPGYLEIRSIDAQECTKSAAALSHMGERIATADADLEKLLPQTEDELRHNLRAATLYGDRARISIRGDQIALPRYAKYMAEVLFEDNGYYSSLLKDRFFNPPARRIREKLKQREDLVDILAFCLENNKTIYEV